MIHIGLLGARGRMGHWVSQLIAQDYSAQARLQAQAGRGDALEPLLSTDAVIDFSSPEASIALAELALARAEGIAGKSSGGRLPVFVIGSTGWKPEQLQVMDRLAAQTPVILSGNFSTGVLALQKILKTFAPMLVRLGYSPSMVETHHVHKKDAPSGTALLLNRTIEAAAGVGPIPTQSIREGEVIGDHAVTFDGPADQITLSHSAKDRSVFARGAIDAALWAHRKQAELSSLKKPLSMELFLEDFLRASSK